MTTPTPTPKPKLAIQIAMPIEAQGIIEALDLQAMPDYFDARLPLKAYQRADLPELLLVVNGDCPQHGCARVGTQAAAVAAWEIIRVFKPDLLLSAGTAGGFSERSEIGEVFLSEACFSYHGRDIPVPGFAEYERGRYPAYEVPGLAEALAVRTAKISTSDTIRSSELELARLAEENITCKEMEAASIAEVAMLTHTPFFALKVVTDFIDQPEDMAEQFVENFQLAINHLASKVLATIAFLGFIPA